MNLVNRVGEEYFKEVYFKHTRNEMAEMFSCSRKLIDYWVTRMLKEGRLTNKGRPNTWWKENKRD